MRNLFIALVLFATALTFYSALWFKSESIEDDITARVTDDLNTAGAKGVDVGVDGRHVTLTGVVFDEQVETSYLSTANDTYGALGPIDGLTYQTDGGYVSASKTEDGITLRGTVPNDSVRAALVENATAATDGAVDDQLATAGPEAPWQDEAAFGVSQLAGLTTGTLSAAAGSYALSGVTDGDVADVSSPIADREGWSAFVSSPKAEMALSDDVTRLNGQVAERDTTIVGLQTSLADLEGQAGEVTAERDAISAELTTLRGSLTEGQSSAANLQTELSANQADLDAARAMLSDKDQNITDLSGRIDTLTATNTDLSDKLNAAQSSVGGMKAQVGTLTAAVAAKQLEANGLNGRVTELEAELEERQSGLNSTDQQVAALTGELGDAKQSMAGITGKVTGLTSEVANLKGVVAKRDATISDMSGKVTGLTSEVANLKRTVTTRDATIADTSGKVTGMTSEVANLKRTVTTRDAAIAGMSGKVTGLTSEVANLKRSVTTRDATIADLNGKVTGLDAEVVNLNGTIEGLQADASSSMTAAIETRDAKIADLTGKVADAEGEVTRLSGELDGRDAELADSATKMAALMVTAETGDADTSALRGQVSDLTATVAERDETIAALQNRAPQTSNAQQCAAQASAAMEGSRINFRTATATIDQSSTELLERMTGIALACVSDGLAVEIGGHTDAQGTDEANQALSEARAQAVVAFMAERGVPTEGLRAVGYGEAQPVADNATSEGRAQNRRISFDWQAR